MGSTLTVRETKAGLQEDRISINSDNPSAPTTSEGSGDGGSDPASVIEKHGYYVIKIRKIEKSNVGDVLIRPDVGIQTPVLIADYQ